MDLNNLANSLVVAASGALGLFILAVFADLGAAAAVAVKKGEWDWHKFPQFMEAQFATKQLLGVLTLGVTAAGAAFASTIIDKGIGVDALQAIAQVALSAMTLGAAAMAASVWADARAKLGEFFGGAVVPPAVVEPIPVQIVDPPVPPA
jgi:hypothetical protein